MRYQVKVEGVTVAGAWTLHAVSMKAITIVFNQAERPPRLRFGVEIWEGLRQISEIGPVICDDDDDLSPLPNGG